MLMDGAACGGHHRHGVGIGTLPSTITVNTRGKDVMLAVPFVPLISPAALLHARRQPPPVVVGRRGISTCSRSRWLAGGHDVIMPLVSWVLYDFRYLRIAFNLGDLHKERKPTRINR